MESNGREAVDPTASGQDETFFNFRQLMAAVDAGQIADVENSLKKCEFVDIDLANTRVRRGQLALTIFGHAVVTRCDPEVLKLLLDRANMGVNYQEQLGQQDDGGGNFPLIHIAAYVCNFQAVKLLCDSPDVDLDVAPVGWDPAAVAPAGCGLTPLHMSVKGGDPNIVNHILQRARKRQMRPNLHDRDWFAGFLNQRDNLGMTSLHHAAWEGREGVVARLLHEDAIAVNAQDIHGFTSLHFASWNNHLGVVNQLLQHPRINPQVQSEKQMGILGNVFYIDGMPGYTITNSMRYQERYFPSAIDRQDGYFPESVDEARFMLERSLSPKLLPTFYPDKNNVSVTALHCAAFAGHSDIVGALVEAISRKACARKTLNAIDDHLMSPLHYAIIGGDASTVHELLTSLMVRGNPEEKRCNLAPLDMTAILIDHSEDCYFVHEYKAIKSLLLGRPEVKAYFDSLYRDRQVFVDAANAILVGAALIASITFVGWLQPPLGFTPYYEPQYLLTGSAPPGTYDSFAAVGQHSSVQVFWIFNSFSFFFAMATVLTGAGAVLPSQDIFMKAEVEHIRILLIRTSLVLSVSIFFALGAFTAAGFASLPPRIKYQWGMLASSSIGCSVCVIVLGYYLGRVFRLFPRLVGPTRRTVHQGVRTGLTDTVTGFVQTYAPYVEIVAGRYSALPGFRMI